MNASVPEMIDLTEEQWNKLFDTADETVQKAIAELPEPVRVKAETWICWLEKYSPRSTSTQKVLGICGMSYGFGASAPVITATTPSSALAREVSICLIRACGYGEWRILPTSVPGRLRSSVYLPAPVVLPAASTMAT